MPDCVVDVALVTGAVLGYRHLAGTARERERERKRKLGVLSDISQKSIQRDFAKNWPITHGAEQKLPLGADSSAQAALRAVQLYQDSRTVPKRSFVLPAVWLGWLYFGGCGEDSSGHCDVETAVCEELKLWLLSAAGGGVTAEEASQRLHFYRQILMWPEVFNQAGFLALLATVCERLDEVSERLASSMRTCALQLNKVMNLARDFINSMMPLLVLAITDTMSKGSLPLLDVEVLVRSACGEKGDGRQPLDELWAKDCGRLLRELLTAPHLLQLWGLSSESGRGRGQGLLGVRLELHHSWEDALDSGHDLPESGLFEFFARKDHWRVLQSYLSLVENLDKLSKFTSMIEPYKVLANIAGDAAMYRLRDTFHHLLQEVECALVQAERDASRVLEASNRAVIDLTIRNQATKRQTWLERLQLIDEQAQGGTCKELVEALAELKYLTCDARRPELEAACQRSLGQISDILSSEDFRGRCTELPPELPHFALQGPPMSTMLTMADAPAWSVERQLQLDSEELAREDVQAIAGQQLSCRRDQLGQLVASLNNGEFPDPGDFCVVCFEDTRNFIGLYKPGRREAVVDTLGLNNLQYIPQSPQARVIDQGPIDFGLAEEVETATTQDQPTPTAEAVQVAPADESECVAKELQQVFYKVLLAMLPVPDDADAPSRAAVRDLLQRANPRLPEAMLQWILEAVLPVDGTRGSVDRETLQTVGQLVAHAQAGHAEPAALAALRSTVPKQVPCFDGVLWDPQRPEKISLLVPFEQHTHSVEAKTRQQGLRK